jgi:hypothetical protein
VKVLGKVVALVVLLVAGALADAAEVGAVKLGTGTSIEYETVAWKLLPNGHGPAGPMFGTDDPLPRIVLRRLTLIRGSTRIPLEISCMYDPWFERPDASRFRFRVLNSHSAVLRGVFSDAAGSYVAEWLIVDGIGVRTLLSNDPVIIRERVRR